MPDRSPPDRPGVTRGTVRYGGTWMVGTGKSNASSSLEMPVDPADLFQCPRHPGILRLMPPACANLWRASKTAQPWDRGWLCRGCEIGAGHAGEALPLASSEDDTGRACVFCGRSDQRLVGGLICITEFNRLAELLSGHYRRANPPGLGARLHRYRAITNETDGL